MSRSDIIITSRKNCNTYTYNTGLLDGLGFVLMTFAISVFMCFEFDKT